MVGATIAGYETNGYIVSRLVRSAKDVHDPDHRDADIYLKKFRSLEETLYREVHPNVDIGLAIAEAQAASDAPPNIFTGHGSQHICDLIKSLDKLAKAISAEQEHSLSVLEAYILLCAAHVHDSGNVAGRTKHAQRCDKLLEHYKNLFSGSVELQQIFDVASAHGGKDPEHGEDVFRRLDSGNDDSARLPLLASLLRLGDELSENPGRVPESVLEAHKHSNESKLAQAYARSFAKFSLRINTLYLVYNIYAPQKNLVVEVEGASQSFFDFLEYKIDVIEKESRYCSQYGRPALDIKEIDIVIREFDVSTVGRYNGELKFHLYLSRGYPEIPAKLCKRSPELAAKSKQSLAQCFEAEPFLTIELPKLESVEADTSVQVVSEIEKK